MYDAIKNFARQFSYTPIIENEPRLRERPYISHAIIGMGGSHLAAGLLKTWDPGLRLIIHKDYGLPALPEDQAQKTLFIASSYSGNTEETRDAFDQAVRENLPRAAISTGGTLMERATKDCAPYIQMPQTGIQPRSALGFSTKALLKIMGHEKGLQEISALADILRPETFEQEGRALAQKLKGRIPVIYSSTRNESLAYNWKIKFNETGKIPAFYNVFPELNHNEMNGFDPNDASQPLSERFFFIFLKDEKDHPRIQRRMEALETMLRERGFPVEIKNAPGASSFEKIFSSLVLGDWTAYYTAQQYGLEPERVPLIEEFKKRIA